MKKLSVALSFAALIAASPSFADDNVNYSSIGQIGIATDADVTQIGHDNKNSSWITQGVLPGGAVNASASVIQSGHDNEYNWSAITQDGSNNTAEVEQKGDHNKNSSTINQTGFGITLENKASVTQKGDHNTNGSSISQTGFNNLVTVEQSGDHNTNTSGVTQSGLGLTATVTQN